MVLFGRDQRKIHEEILIKAVDHAKNVKPSVAVSPRLGEGDPALEIVAVAKEEGFDLLWLGTGCGQGEGDRLVGWY